MRSRGNIPSIAGVATAAAVAAGAIQLPRGQHYLTDILAGAAIGLVADIAVERLERVVARIADDR